MAAKAKVTCPGVTLPRWRHERRLTAREAAQRGVRQTLATLTLCGARPATHMHTWKRLENSIPI